MTGERPLEHTNEPPRWLVELNAEIDSLQFGPGFAHLDERTTFHFGTNPAIGRSEIEAFFLKIDTAYDTLHRIHDVWDGGSKLIMRGDAVMRPKGTEDLSITRPMVWIITLDEGNPDVIRDWYLVNGPVGAENLT